MTGPSSALRALSPGGRRLSTRRCGANPPSAETPFPPGERPCGANPPSAETPLPPGERPCGANPPSAETPLPPGERPCGANPPSAEIPLPPGEGGRRPGEGIVIDPSAAYCSVITFGM